MRRAIERAWHADDAPARAVRGVLAPASLAYRAAVAVRNALYDRGILPVATPPIPVIGVGNLTVGGTGKTPVAAWVAHALSERGATPAIVMRGYGDDEPRVHEALNPGIRVVVDADRVRGVETAALEGADVAVLDDGFQHRRLGRAIDLVLVSADRWQAPRRLLPAGPWREALTSLARATAVIVTRKATGDQVAEPLCRQLAPLTRAGVGAVARLSLGELVDIQSGTSRSLETLRGESILVVAGVGDPSSLAAQLAAAGATVHVRAFPDHHVYATADITTLTLEAGQFDRMVCTLKDAVKLGPLWPRGAKPVWYVSQRVDLGDGRAGIEALLDQVIASRPMTSTRRPAGPAPSQSP